MYSDISEEWRNGCEKIKVMSEPLPLNQFGVDRYDRCLATEFRVVSYMTQTQKHLQKLDQNPDHFALNRNANIMPFQQNRVTLGPIQQKNLAENYINASYINIYGQKLIATQGPLNSTVLNFWRMIEQNNVSLIFMLCERIQKGKIKCDFYWPHQKDTPLKIGHYQISMAQLIEQKNLRIRKMIARNLEKNNQMKVTQYQILHWADGDSPSKVCEKTVRKVNKVMMQAIDKEQTPVVHCSAGVGRTGTFIAMAEIRKLISTSETLSIFECVRKLREQRWAMVYTETQYEYLYTFAENLANRKCQAYKQDKTNESDSDS